MRLLHKADTKSEANVIAVALLFYGTTSMMNFMCGVVSLVSSGFTAACSQSIEQTMPNDNPVTHDNCSVVPALEVEVIVEAWRQHLQGTHNYAMHCPRPCSSPEGRLICWACQLLLPSLPNWL